MSTDLTGLVTVLLTVPSPARPQDHRTLSRYSAIIGTKYDMGKCLALVPGIDCLFSEGKCCKEQLTNTGSVLKVGRGFYLIRSISK